MTLNQPVKCATCAARLPEWDNDPAWSPDGVYFCDDVCFYASPERVQA